MRDLTRDVASTIVAANPAGARLMVAIDGVGAAGKTTFAERLAARIAPVRPVIVVHGDDFFNDTSTRHARGRFSAEGFWRDAYNIAALQQWALQPLRQGADHYRAASFDVVVGQPVRPEPIEAEKTAIVVVEGAFLHRDELTHYWDYSVFLDVPLREAARRMQARSGQSGTLPKPLEERYLGAQRIYFDQVQPWKRASVIINNAKPDKPAVVPPDRTLSAR